MPVLLAWPKKIERATQAKQRRVHVHALEIKRLCAAPRARSRPGCIAVAISPEV